MVADIQAQAADWQYDVVAIGDNNACAFIGGYRLWEGGSKQEPAVRTLPALRAPRAA